MKKNLLKSEREGKEILDAYGRRIDYLRISLTDRCNLRCIYCMPREGIRPLKHEEVLTLEEVYRIAEIFTDMGIRRIRLTGGEPLVRKNMASLVQKLAELESRPELSLTTNGILLGEYLEEFCRVGLQRINVSLDTRDPETFQRITGCDALKLVERNVERAIERNVKVRINSVLIWGVNDGETAELAAMAKELPLDVRFIELMPMGCASALRGVAKEEILNGLEKNFGQYEICQREPYPYVNDKNDLQRGEQSLERVEGPAEYVRFQGFHGRIGFISPLSHSFCQNCNRVRLTADGRLKLCLYHSDGEELLPLLRGGCSDDELEEVIRRAIKRKPKQHDFGKMESPGKALEERNMNQIGG